MTRPQYDRPNADEHAPYYSTYIDKVPSGDLLTLLATQIADFTTAVEPISEERSATSYAPGKWTIKEVVGHLTDSERVFTYRAMTFARGDSTGLPSFDENAWVPPAKFNERTFTSLVHEWVAVRTASIALFSGLPPEAPARRGTASNKEISVRALAHIIHGHVVHHLGVLRERYLA